MRSYTDKQYIKLVENIDDQILQSMMKKEIEIIKQVKNSKEKTFIDLGAGHGRLTPILGEIAKNIISIEINPNMLNELKRRNSKFDNSEIILGDITKLSQELKEKELQNPVLLLIQNTLGTIEGKWKKVLEEMKKVAKDNEGEIIISFFRVESLKNWGAKLYTKTKEMTGEVNMDKTNFQKGEMITSTGYTSKWRSKEEIKEIINFLDGELIKDFWTDNWVILHINFN